MVGRKHTVYFVDTETTYNYKGKPISYPDLKLIEDSEDFDLNELSAGRCLFGLNSLDDEKVVFMFEKEFSEWIGSLRDKNFIYIHNLKFDIAFIGKMLHDNGFEARKFLGKRGSVITVNFRKPKIDLQFRDMMKMTGTSLAKSGEMLGCSIKKGEFPITSESDLDLPVVREYLEKDVKLLREIYIKALKLTNDIENELKQSESRILPLTIGSLSKKIFLETGFPIKSTKGVFRNRAFGWQSIFGMLTKEQDRYFRKFYFGGHGGAFMPTDDKHFEKVHYHDKSSMYPSVLAKNEFPTAKGALSFKKFMPSNKFYPFAFYEVKVDYCFIKYGIIPSIISGKHFNQDVSLLLDEDTQRDEPLTLYLIDYYNDRSDWKNFLKDYGGHFEVVKSTLFQARKMPESFVALLKYFYEKKELYKHTNKPLSSWYKVILNAFYGKIGQGFTYEKSTFDWHDDKQKYVYEIVKDEYEDNSDGQMSVIVASCVTMFARNELLNMCDLVGHQNVILTATDAVIFVDTPETKEAVKKLDAIRPFPDTKMGTVDGEIVYKFALHGTKSYQYYKDGDLITKVAGIPEAVKEGLTFKWWLTGPINIKKSIGVVGGVYLKELLFTPKENPAIIINRNYKEFLYEKE